MVYAPEFPFKLARSLSFWPNTVFFLPFIYRWNSCKLHCRVINYCILRFYCYLLQIFKKECWYLWSSLLYHHTCIRTQWLITRYYRPQLRRYNEKQSCLWAASVACTSADNLSMEKRTWTSTDGNMYFLTQEAIQVMAKGCPKGTTRKWAVLLSLCPYFPNKCRISLVLSLQHPSEGTCFLWQISVFRRILIYHTELT